MSGPKPQPVTSALADAPAGLRKTGVRAWLVLGIAGVVALGAWFVSTTAGLTIPLIVAAIVGILFAPTVDILENHRVPRALGAFIVLIALIVVVVGTVWITVSGVLTQSAQIASSIDSALQSLSDSLHRLDIPAEMIPRIADSLKGVAGNAAGGVLSAFSSGLSGSVAFLFGTFLGVFMLFYMLSDWATIVRWFADHLGLPRDLGEAVVLDGVLAVRQYFKAVTISSFVVGVVIGLAVWLLGLPLAIPIALVTFLTGYIPYFGAIFSSAFAFLIALGSGGIQQAMITLVVILVAQNLIQTIISNYYTADELDLHPLVALISTLLGGTFGGLLGSVLGAPIMALSLRANKRFKEYGGMAEERPSAASEDPDTALGT